MPDLLQFQPLYQERVWGGRQLAAVLGRSLPDAGPVGESWELVDRPEAQSVVLGGPDHGLTLRTLLARDPELLMGPGWPRDRPFPILVKWLDCRERLSLQVHPPAAVAPQLGGEPKTENWFIAQSTPGSQLLVGLRRGVTRARFERALADQTLEDCVHRFPVGPGDSMLVRSGQIHAIDAGNLILEIQQNSDTTYRVYDWGRVGLDGRPRQLHVEQSLRSIDWSDIEPAPLRAAARSEVIADCPEFRIRRLVLAPGGSLSLSPGEQARIVSVVAGSVSVDASPALPHHLRRGDNVLVPFAAGALLRAAEAATLLVTENFSPAGRAT